MDWGGEGVIERKHRFDLLNRCAWNEIGKSIELLANFGFQ